MDFISEMRDYVHRVSIFDASYFPQEEHAKCAMLEQYLNTLVASLADSPGRLNEQEWERLMDDLSLIHIDPIKYTYMFFLMLNTIVISALELEMMSKVMNDMFNKDIQNTTDRTGNGYL